jgi:hypothetical protein
VSALAIILILLALLILALVAGGYVAVARRTGARDEQLLKQLRQAERALAQAHAADKGWDRATLEAAARAAAAQRFGGSGVRALRLVQVIDRPGTDADQAVFLVDTDDGQHSITLGRSGGVWGAA